MENKFERDLDPIAAMGIGITKLVIDWMDLSGLPYNKENFRFLRNSKENIISIEVPIDNNKMLENYKKIEKYHEEKNIPDFVKEGELFITFKF